jgi:hypothetical protein
MSADRNHSGRSRPADRGPVQGIALNSQRKIICQSLRREAHIEARCLAGSYVDLHLKRLVARLLNANAMRSCGELNDKSILSLRSTPRFVVDVNSRVARLHAKGKGAVSLRVGG